MTWDAAYDVDDTSFVLAVDWFAQRVPFTEGEFERDIEQARKQAFWISGVTQAEMIRQVHDSLRSAIDKGTPFEEWQKEIGPVLEKAWVGQLGADEQAFRTETIMRNWAQSSYARARWKQMDEPAIRRLRPYRMFDAVRDSRTSPICEACDGTVLPADDPWWDTHRTPMHHRCRSGIRSLTERKAKALGITEKAPGVEAQDGFGTDEEYQGPDRSKFAPKVKPPPPPPPPEPPKPVLERRAADMARAIELRDSADQAEVRGILREQIQEVFPGAAVRDQQRDALEVANARLKKLKADGAHYGNGRVEITSAVQDAVRHASSDLAVGRKPTPWKLDRGLRVLLHEELHGHSAKAFAAYTAGARVLEEVGTELSARAIVGHLLATDGLVIPELRTYQRYIDKLADIVSRHTGESRKDALRRLLRTHELAILAPGPELRSLDEYENAWADALGVTRAQRAAILQELRQYAATNPAP